MCFFGIFFSYSGTMIIIIKLRNSENYSYFNIIAFWITITPLSYEWLIFLYFSYPIQMVNKIVIEISWTSWLEIKKWKMCNFSHVVFQEICFQYFVDSIYSGSLLNESSFYLLSHVQNYKLNKILRNEAYVTLYIIQCSKNIMSIGSMALNKKHEVNHCYFLMHT